MSLLRGGYFADQAQLMRERILRKQTMRMKIASEVAKFFGTMGLYYSFDHPPPLPTTHTRQNPPSTLPGMQLYTLFFSLFKDKVPPAFASPKEMPNLSLVATQPGGDNLHQEIDVATDASLGVRPGYYRACGSTNSW